MGFDTNTVWYHGTRTGRINLADKVGPQPWLPITTDVSLAENFGATSVIPMYLKKGIAIFDGSEEHVRRLKDVMPDRLKGKDRLGQLALGNWFELEGVDATYFSQAGFEGYKFIEKGKPAIAIDPKNNIRSVNATFDPAEAGSARLMAALSGYRQGRNVTEPENLRFWQKPPKSGDVLMFHGTRKTFDKFDMSYSRDFGVHFGTAEQASERLITTDMEGARTIPVEITLKNAIVMPDPGFGDQRKWLTASCVQDIRSLKRSSSASSGSLLRSMMPRTATTRRPPAPPSLPPTKPLPKTQCARHRWHLVSQPA